MGGTCDCGNPLAVRSQTVDGRVEVRTLDACEHCLYLDGYGAEANIIAALRLRGEATIYDLADDLNLSTRSVQRALYRLHRRGRVRRVLRPFEPDRSDLALRTTIGWWSLDVSRMRQAVA